MSWQYVVEPDTGGKYRWKLNEGTAHMASSGESFYSEADARRAQKNFKAKCALWAYSSRQAADRRWSWHARAANNENVAWSGGMHANQASCDNEMNHVKANGHLGIDG